MACDAKLRVPAAHEGDTLDCHFCGESIVVGGRRMGVRRRRSSDLGVPAVRSAESLRAVGNVALAGAVVAVVGWGALSPGSFASAVAVVWDGVITGWTRLFELLMGGG